MARLSRLTLRADVEALVALGPRDSAGAGERRAADWVAQRLREAGAVDVAVEPYRFRRTYAWAHAAWAALGLLGGRAGALAALAGLELDASGRAPLLGAPAGCMRKQVTKGAWPLSPPRCVRKQVTKGAWPLSPPRCVRNQRKIGARPLFPPGCVRNQLGRLGAGEGANAVARIAAAGEPRATLVICAHHDAARTGLVWHPALHAATARRARTTHAIGGFQQLTALAFALRAAGERRLSRALLLLTIALELDVARSPTVPGASDDASGVAALLALATEFAAAPLDGVEVQLVSTGCEESGMGGMRAYLDAERVGALRARPALVLSLDTLGAGTPIVAWAEGTIARHTYAADDLDLADAGARRAGLEPPQRWRIGGWTDPILARHRGLRAISMLSMGDGRIPHYHRPDDTPDNVDWDCAERCLALARGIAQEWAARLSSP